MRKLSNRMESFINTNDMLKQTVLPEIFRQGELQRKADIMLGIMDARYSEDKQYQYIMEEALKDKFTPMSLENPFKSTRVAGFMAKMYNWVRDHEIQQLREEYDKAQRFVWPLKFVS